MPRRATSTTTVAFAPISPSSARIQTSLCSSHHHRSDLNFDITRLTHSIPSTKLRTFRPAFFPAAPAFSRTFATASVRRPTAHLVHMRTAAHRPRTRTRHQDSSDTFLPTATPPAAARYPASLLTTRRARTPTTTNATAGHRLPTFESRFLLRRFNLSFETAARRSTSYPGAAHTFHF